MISKNNQSVYNKLVTVIVACNLEVYCKSDAFASVLLLRSSRKSGKVELECLFQLEKYSYPQETYLFI